MKEGNYKGILILSEKEGVELPFNFEVQYKAKKPVIIFRNADERIKADEVSVRGDSVFIKMPVFDTEFKCKLVKEGLQGVWINNYRKTQNIIPFKAIYGISERFGKVNGPSMPLFDGKWEIYFSPGSADSTKAIGIFKHEEQSDLLTGTFLTETGDYRYLEGIRSGNEFSLSAFDGSHAFLFKAILKNNKLEGVFYSGTHWRENFTGFKNDLATLKDPEEITYVKDPGRPMEFSFYDLNNTLVSLSDKKFANKPVIIQIMGSWCPNCLDESAYFSKLYNDNNKNGLEIIAIAFEKTTEPEKARKQVTRLRDRLDLKYTVLLSLQTGKDKASEIFPELSTISAFPTAIFLNRQHRVVKIHTGFSGPATGNEFVAFRQRTENLINNLLKE